VCSKLCLQFIYLDPERFRNDPIDLIYASYASYVPLMKMMKTPSDGVCDAFYLFYYVFCVLWATVTETDSVFFF
jgi:hypothetical protein